MATNFPETAEKASRNRHNINLAEDAKERGEQMAKTDLRSFSNFVEWLIQQEWSRRDGKGAEANGERAGALVEQGITER